MTRSPNSAELRPGLASDAGADPELEALPEPRRPGRMLTLAAMTLTVLFSLFMTYSLIGEARYAMQRGRPLDLGNLARAVPTSGQANTWVRGEAALATTGAIRYSRPLETDSYRMTRVADNDRIWVQIRVPAGLEDRYFVPPTSFVGRLVPISEAGLRHRGLEQAAGMSDNAWLLIDGEAPSTTRWALGLLTLFVAFAIFNIYGLVRLLRPVKDG